MLPIFALCYVLIPADLPVVAVKPFQAIAENATLEQFASTLTADSKIVAFSCDVPLRRTVKPESGIVSTIAADPGFVVFQNSSAIYTKMNELQCTDVSDPTVVQKCGIVSGVTDENFAGYLNQVPADTTVIIFEKQPEVSYGVANPFTPTIWNCFFYFLLMIVLICWAMKHFATISVQEKFAKKNN